MKQDDQPEQQAPVPATHPARRWLLGCIVVLLLLVITALLVAPHLIASASVKQKIQATITEQTGGQIDYQTIELSYLPRPTIALRQITLAIPEQAEGTIASLSVTPELLPLLSGDLHLARLELETPVLSLTLPVDTTEQTPAPPYEYESAEKSLAATLEPFTRFVPTLELQVSNGQLTLQQGKQDLAEAEGLSFGLKLSLENPPSALANLQAGVSRLSLHRNGDTQTAGNLNLSGSAELAHGAITVTLDRLALTEPTLELAGRLVMTKTSPAITLKISGSDIDVDATRKVALALAGDTTPVKEIFDYLRGGYVPQIRFSSQGDAPSDLGELDNILIEGRLQEGKVSIPEINLDLTEVVGDVLISKGVLQGTDLSTRLEGSTGRDGTLKVALGEENDLFQLELSLSANLAETKPILQRIVDSPAFVAELKKITNLQGTGQGRMVLGDSLNDINARVDVKELNLSADYQRIPFPISIAKGQFAFSKGQIDLKKLSGQVGQSQFSELSCQFNLGDDSIDIRSGRFGLFLTELYPWLTSFEEMRDRLEEVTQMTGRIDLSALSLKGVIENPSGWQYTASGSVQDMTVETELFPDTVRFSSGTFNLGDAGLTFEKLKAVSLDATPTLTGKLSGFPQPLSNVELSLDGTMGPDAIEWLSETLEVPEAYAIHAPLNLVNAQVSWQPEATTTFKGVVNIEQGPAITADIDYLPEQLQVHQLRLKDQHSDVNMVMEFAKARHDFKFVGSLSHKTLNNLFVNRDFDSGLLQGDIAVSVPQTGPSPTTAQGNLTGTQLSIPAPSGDDVIIDQVTLNADGAEIKADFTKFVWKNLTWEPVKTTLSFDQDRIDIRVAEAKLCGINSPGVISFAGEDFTFDMTLEGKELDVESSYTCLTDGRVKMTGTLDFSSQLTAEGQTGDLLNSLKGPLEMTFSNGVVEQDKVLTRTLEVLNVTEIVKGRLPNLRSSGFAYTTATVESEFQNGKLFIHKFFMDGETLDLLGNGTIGLEDATIDVELLAAPFKTVDTVVRNIPGVNYLLAGSLVTIPVSVKGTLDEPRVRVMSASSVGKSLYNLGERTIKSPLRLIETLIPGSNKGQE